METTQRLYNMYLNAPPPLGYDLKMIWPKGVDDRGLGALKLEPWRIELSRLGGMMAGKPALVWHAKRWRQSGPTRRDETGTRVRPLLSRSLHPRRHRAGKDAWR